MQLHGLIKWNVKQKELRYVPDQKATHKAYVVKWSGRGKLQSKHHLAFFYLLKLWFIQAHGGPRGVEQFAVKGIRDVHKKWCEYALDSWGTISFEAMGGLEWPRHLR